MKDMKKNKPEATTLRSAYIRESACGWFTYEIIWIELR